jgi:hypothetical protein
MSYEIYDIGKRKPWYEPLEPAVPVATERPWVGLTDEELWDTAGYKEDRAFFRFARAVEAKLKEKNA